MDESRIVVLRKQRRIVIDVGHLDLDEHEIDQFGNAAVGGPYLQIIAGNLDKKFKKPTVGGVPSVRRTLPVPDPKAWPRSRCPCTGRRRTADGDRL